MRFLSLVPDYLPPMCRPCLSRQKQKHEGSQTLEKSRDKFMFCNLHFAVLHFAPLAVTYLASIIESWRERNFIKRRRWRNKSQIREESLSDWNFRQSKMWYKDILHFNERFSSTKFKFLELALPPSVLSVRHKRSRCRYLGNEKSYRRSSGVKTI